MNRAISIACLGLLPLVGCRSPATSPALRAARTMDEVSSGLARYGTMTISAPVVSLPDDRFAFDLTVKPDDLYKSDREEFEGRAAVLDEVMRSLSAGLSVAYDPTLAAAYGLQMAQFAQATDRNAGRQAMVDQQLRLQNDSARLTRDQEIRAAQLDYASAVVKAGQEKDEATRQAALTEAEKARDAADAAAQAKFAAAVKVPDLEPVPSIPTSPTTRPTEASAEVEKSPTDARGVLSGDGKLAGVQGLFPANSPASKVSPRSAIISAAGDNATKAIFQVLGKPQLSAQFSNKQTLFGVAMVSVNPGWGTRIGFAADLSVLCKYHYKPARPAVVEAFVQNPAFDRALRKRVATDNGRQDLADRITGVDAAEADLTGAFLLPADGESFDTAAEPGVPGPMVAAVSPMTETQALDLGSGRREQNELALQLALALNSAGLTAQARTFYEYVHRHQEDVDTATANVAVNAYSHSGVYGFQVGPRLKAVEEVRHGKLTGPAETLERQSFPTLILFGMDQADLMRVKVAGGHAKLYEAELVLIATGAWTPLTASSQRCGLSEEQRLIWSEQLKAATKGMSGDDSEGRRVLFDSKLMAMRYRVEGHGDQIDLPEDLFQPKTKDSFALPAGTRVTEIAPAPSVQLDRNADKQPVARLVQLMLNGDKLDGVKLDGIRVALGNARVLADTDEHRPRLVAGSVIVWLQIDDAQSPVVLELPSRTDVNQSVLSPQIAVTIKPAAVDAPGPAKDVSITRKGGPADHPVVDELTFPPSAPEAVVREFAKSRRGDGKDDSDHPADPAGNKPGH